ncbi:ABC-type Zn uptake system ZnuABC Zn-binding protein ZnuA [Advenella incenata]|uniref:ABC-type Zn uptake system ZnuABC Zn-binding protein ZnuA n=1 Tax=Advenella incenata TaxID=267800 RepID=A0A4Q7VU01_9BURK|nr:zinc ABC transporter substrate-binding protein [Advenella incenata]RZT99807.1 ABC-type Zn uptake system ZnuABC Zn-binding protein ZnuA [Advenella incenata]
MKPIAVSPPSFSQIRLALLTLCMAAALANPSLAQDNVPTRSRSGANTAAQTDVAPGAASTATSAAHVSSSAQSRQTTTVVAAHPVVYGLLEALTQGSGIVPGRATPANLPASRHYSYLSGRGAKSFDRIVRKADAVVHLRSIWPDDPLYPLARKHNIRVIEIDAANPVDHGLPGIASTADTNTAADYPWLNPVNMGRMADIIASDVQRLEPDAKDKVEANLATLRQRLIALNAQVESALLDAPNLSVVVLSPRLHTLAGAFNLDVVPVTTPADWNAQTLATLGTVIRDNGVHAVLLHEAASPEVAAAITGAGAKPVVVETDGEDPVGVLEAAGKTLVQALVAGSPG